MATKDCPTCTGTGTVKFFKATSAPQRCRKANTVNEMIELGTASKVAGELLDPNDRDVMEAKGLITEAD